jgi:alpha-mannosidase
MLEYGRRMEKGIQGCPVVKQSTSLDFFKDLDKKVSGNKRLPTWCGELYLEFHRGTLTSQARNKKYNRKSECLYHDVETLSAIANMEIGLTYPREELLKNWKTILLNQFHDILPGSSIQRVYDESLERYKILYERANELKEKAVLALAEKITAPAEFESPKILFNTLSFERKYNVKTENGVVSVTIPPMGYKVIDISGKSAKQSKMQTLENDYIKVTLLEDGRNVRSLWK